MLHPIAVPRQIQPAIVQLLELIHLAMQLATHQLQVMLAHLPIQVHLLTLVLNQILQLQVIPVLQQIRQQLMPLTTPLLLPTHPQMLLGQSIQQIPNNLAILLQILRLLPTRLHLQIAAQKIQIQQKIQTVVPQPTVVHHLIAVQPPIAHQVLMIQHLVINHLQIIPLQLTLQAKIITQQLQIAPRQTIVAQ
jgi:hypothetical protein